MGSVAAKGLFLLVILAIVGFGLYLANWDAPAPNAPEVFPIQSSAFVGKVEVPPVVQTPSASIASDTNPTVEEVPTAESAPSRE